MNRIKLDCRQNGETPLHIAVRYCQWEVTDELLTFVTKNKARLDAVMLVNHQNTVSQIFYS